MKKTILAAALLFSSLAMQTTDAQVRISLGLNIGTQPAWGPVGYDHVEYYYMPDIDAFYYVPRQQYIYMSRGRWVFTTILPPRFSNYDFNTGYKVVVNESQPYYNAQMYRTKYASYRGRHDQEIIRNSRDSRYFENRGHPEYNNWIRDHDQRGGNEGRGRGNQGRGRGDNRARGNNGHGNGNGNHHDK